MNRTAMQRKTCNEGGSASTVAVPRIQKKRKSQEDDYGQVKQNKTDEVTCFNSTKITFERFKNLTSRDKPDIQYRQQYLQLQCIRCRSPNISSMSTDDGRNSYLMINDDGEVVSNGNRSDQRTCLEIINWFPKSGNENQIIGHTSTNKPLILYVNGKQIKTKAYHPPKNYHSLDRSTIFEILGRDDKPAHEFPVRIKSAENGIYINFDKSGKLKSCPHHEIDFQPSIFQGFEQKHSSRETSV